MKYEESFYTSQPWRELRYEALKIHGAACQCCGRTRKDGAVIHVDHIKPRSKYPHLELEITNLQILCEDCNLGKLHKDETDWRQPREATKLEGFLDRWFRDTDPLNDEESAALLTIIERVVALPHECAEFVWDIGFDPRTEKWIARIKCALNEEWQVQEMVNENTEECLTQAFARAIASFGHLLASKQGQAKNRFNWAHKKREAAETALEHAELAADEYIRGPACEMWAYEREVEESAKQELACIYALRDKHDLWLKAA